MGGATDEFRNRTIEDTRYIIKVLKDFRKLTGPQQKLIELIETKITEYK